MFNLKYKKNNKMFEDIFLNEEGWKEDEEDKEEGETDKEEDGEKDDEEEGEDW